MALESSPLNPRYALEDYIVAPSNELAYRAVERLAQGEFSIARNPLYLCGATGRGKTHLLQGLGLALRAAGSEPFYLSAGEFRDGRLGSSSQGISPLDALADVGVLLIDDVETLPRSSALDSIYRAVAYLLGTRVRVVVASTVSPSELTNMDADVRTKLGMGLVAPVGAMETALRRAILLQHIACVQERLPGFRIVDAALNYLAGFSKANGRQLEGVINRLEVEYELTRRGHSLQDIKAIAEELLPPKPLPTIDEIQRRVAEHFVIKLADMTSARRARIVARPRQVAMYLAKMLTKRSLPEIGRKFGGRDHTTVMHACRKVEELMQQDPSFAREVSSIEAVLLP